MRILVANNHEARSYKILCMISYDHRKSDEKLYEDRRL